MIQADDWAGYEFFNSRNFDYREWLSKESWSLEEAAILLNGGSPQDCPDFITLLKNGNKPLSEVKIEDWKVEIFDRFPLTKLTRKALPIWHESTPMDCIQNAVDLGIEIHPTLSKLLIDRGELPKPSVGSKIYKYYSFWARMDIWTFTQAVYLLAHRDIDEQNPFMSSAYYPEREKISDEISQLLRTSISAGRFRDVNMNSYGEYEFNPLEVVEWASSKGYQYPPLLLELMGYPDSRTTKPPVNSAAIETEYTTPYIELMKRAIIELKITKDNQPKVEAELVPWFEQHLMPIEGKQTVNNKAKLMATFVRMPEAQAGGNKQPKKKG